MMFGIIGLLIITIFGGGSPMWLILSHSLCDLFALLFEVSYFVCGVYGWLTWL
jgi:hypothetical protein